MGMGAMVISLDFELYWGSETPCRRLKTVMSAISLGARIAIPAILELFREYGHPRDPGRRWVFLFFERTSELLRICADAPPALQKT